MLSAAVWSLLRPRNSARTGRSSSACSPPPISREVSGEHKRSDAGFTILELMVVVLVIAILLTVAIPTYLGAKDRAKDRVSQTWVRNVYGIQQVYFSNAEQYTASVDALRAIDSSLELTNTLSDLDAGERLVYVDATTTIAPADTVWVAARGATGSCFWIRRQINGGAQYAINDCFAQPALGDFTGSW